MSAHRDPKLSPDDAGFARRIAGVYAPPPMSAASRARFDAELAEKIRGRGRRTTRRFAGLAAMVAAALVLVWLPPQTRTGPPVAGSEGGEMILAIALASDADVDAELPDDYRAISALLAE
jgi:ferric-dicitrate binding protein FerR (iron transport regulator)